MAARFGVAAIFLLLLAPFSAQAQQYQRLHVRSIALASDTAHPQLEQPFHVVLTIRVAEKVTQLANVFLPSFDGAEELGDERQIAQDKTGTTYRETLTLVAHTRGSLAISQAYMDAIDARDGKPKRFLSNALRLDVGAGPQIIAVPLETIAFVVMEIVFVGAAIFIVWVLVMTYRKRATARAVVSPPVLVSPSNQEADPLEAAFNLLRSRRDRTAVLNLRAVLWQGIGADAGETLDDVLRRPQAARAGVRRLLLAVERAAFIEEARLDQAIEEVLCSPR
jgi:hypothetical protein